MIFLRILFLWFMSVPVLVGCSSSSNGSAVDENVVTPKNAGKNSSEDNSEHGDQCGSFYMPSGPQLYYCIKDFHQSMEPDNIIYYFHGVNGSAGEILPHLTGRGLLYDSLASGFNAPVFVSLSFGPDNIIPLEPSADGAASATELFDFAIPKIEKEILKYYYSPQHPPNRHAVGLSLGGYNALNLASIRPHYFKSLIALCPALFNFDPFDSEAVKNYLERNSQVVSSDLVLNTISTLKEKIGNSQNWDTRNPIESAKKGKFDLLPMYVSTGIQDEYGFIEGADALSSIVQAANNNFNYTRTKGTHCAFDLPKLKEFFKKQISSSVH